MKTLNNKKTHVIQVMLVFLSCLSLFFLSAPQCLAASKKHRTAIPVQLLPKGKFNNAITGIKHEILPNGQFEMIFTFEHRLNKKPTSFMTKKPTRLVFDFNKVANKLGAKTKTINLGPVRNYTSAQGDHETRLVLSLQKAVKYKTKLKGRTLHVLLGASSVKDTVLSRPIASSISHHHHSHRRKKFEVKNIDFRRTKDGGAQIVLHLSSNQAAVDIERQASNLMVDVLHAALPRRLQRKLDVTDFDTPVANISLRQTGQDVQVKIHSRKAFNHLAYQVNKDFIVDIKPVKEEAVSGVKKPKYSGERISLNFQNIEVRAVLQLLAEFTGLNIVTSDTVTGSVTLRLHHVPWDQALDIILKARGLAKRQIGNVLLIAPAQEIAQQEQEELQAQNQIQALAPLHAEFIQINYANATDIANLIRSTGEKAQSLLSARGFMSVDTRTNTIWVRDTATNLKEIRELVQRLDVPVRQVLIEGRVVNVDKTFEQDIGVRFGITKQTIPLSGTFSAANSIAGGTAPSTITSSGANPGRLNVNLPATDATSGIGIALANLGRGFLLDLELSAMESEGRGNIVSTPRLITADKHEATIEDGEEIPYQQVTSSGATSVAFKKAVLSIKVTPQITPDNKIVLTIEVHQDKVSNREVLGVPAIDTQMIETQVLVDNGGTVVLGGIYRQTKRHGFKRVPFFSSIPIVGHLFREKSETNDERELLIFITPKVITQAAFHRA